LDCRDTHSLLNGYADGELDLVKNLEVERHMKECQACAAAHKGQLALRSALGSDSLYYQAPAVLERRIKSAIRGESKKRSFIHPHSPGAGSALELRRSPPPP
jgi:anti-sigma factor RsiW